MNALASLGDAFVSICHPTSSLLVAADVAVGIIFGSILGLSTAMAVTLFPPLTFSMMPFMDMNLLVAVHIDGISGGLVPVILLNVPGTASSIAAHFDGHLMAKNGGAGRALRHDTAFPFLGSTFPLLVLTFCAPLLADIALKSTSAENFGISFFTLTTVAVLASGSVVKGVLVGMLGLISVLVGMAPIDGTPRFIFGSSSLMAEFDALPTLINIFAISEILIMAESMGNGKVEVMKIKPIKDSRFTWKELVYQTPNAIRSALIGTGIGILPDIGGNTPGVLSHMTVKNTSKHPGEFGRGCPDNIVATEIANNATIDRAIIPLLVLGILRNGVTTTMLSGLPIHGLSAGPLLFVRNADVVYGISTACTLCSLFILIIEFFETKEFVQLFRMPKHIPMPPIPVPCCMGAYATNNRIFDVQSIILFGAVGYLYYKLKPPTTPFVPRLLIGGIAEVYLRRGIMQYRFFGAFFKRLILDVFFFVATAVVAWSIYKEWRMTGTKKMQHVLKRDK